MKREETVMKKYIVTLLSIVLIVLMVTSCGASDSNQSEPQTDEEAVEEQVSETHYTENQTDMSNYINDGQALISNGWIYTNGYHESNGETLFMKMRLDSSDKTILKDEAFPYFINVKGEYIYATLVEGEEHPSIYRFRLGGEDETKLVDGAFYFIIVGDNMYYTKSDNCADITAFCKADLDGNNEESILEKPIYYPYIADKKLYYQDDQDGETIHMYDMESKQDTKISDEVTYQYVLNDDYMYCLQENNNSDDELSRTLVKIDLSTKETTNLYEGAGPNGLVIKDDKIYFTNRNDNCRIYCIDKSGENIGIITQDDYCSLYGVFDNILIYEDCADDYEYINSLNSCKLDGSEKQTLSNYF